MIVLLSGITIGQICNGLFIILAPLLWLFLAAVSIFGRSWLYKFDPATFAEAQLPSMNRTEHRHHSKYASMARKKHFKHLGRRNRIIDRVHKQTMNKIVEEAACIVHKCMHPNQASFKNHSAFIPHQRFVPRNCKKWTKSKNQKKRNRKKKRTRHRRPRFLNLNDPIFRHGLRNSFGKHIKHPWRPYIDRVLNPWRIPKEHLADIFTKPLPD